MLKIENSLYTGPISNDALQFTAIALIYVIQLQFFVIILDEIRKFNVPKD